MQNNNHLLKLKVSPKFLSWKISETEKNVFLQLFEKYKAKPANNVLEWLSKDALAKRVLASGSRLRLDKASCVYFYVFGCKASFWLDEASYEATILRIILADIDKHVLALIKKDLALSHT